MKTVSNLGAPDLPHQSDRIFITDGGLETTFIFHQNFDLPLFAAFHLLNSPSGTDALRAYYREYADLAV